ncbi:MAG: NYN domain-containing protein [Clostridia bacterium]|nr:NYN domain-containing protein [Clostridia bacterium]
MDRDSKIAVLVDAENVSEKYAQDLLDEVTNYGIPTYKRVYGDWTKPQLSKWKDSLLTYSFTPIQQYSYTSGKNSSDSAMIIDAMDILYSGKVNGFCLVTSDSDFTRLAMRLREAGMLVLGMGEKKTPQPFIKACEKFIYLEVLRSAEEKSEEKQEEKEDAAKKAKKASDKAEEPSVAPLKKVRAVVKDIVNSIGNEDGWAYLADVGNNLSKRMPDFDTRNYGFTKLIDLVSTFNGFEISRIPVGDGGKVNKILIRTK